MEEENTPLLEEEDNEVTKSNSNNADSSKKEGSPKLNLKNMVLFHGKELAGKSFIRSPHYNLVRIGVGKDGIFKLDGSTPKVLAHWKFREVRDSSYSGFSFTLQFRGGRSDYSVRTDDGEAICSYIESFQKNPDKALEQALNNPPESKIPEQGLMTLRRKFSGDPKNQHAPAPEVRFYTLNRRVKKGGSSEFSSKTVPNIEVDRRLRGSPSKPTSNGDRHSYSFEPTQYHSASDVRVGAGGGAKMNGGVPKSASQDKQLARAVLSQRIKKAEQNEKWQSKEVNLSPVSTRGETTSITPPQTNKRWSSNSPHLQRKPPLPDHVTGFSKAGSAPPCLPPDEEGEEAMATNSISKAQGVKQLNNIGKQNPPPSSLGGVALGKGPDERIPLIKREDSSESSEFSPSEDFTFAPSESTKRPTAYNRSSNSSLEEFIKKCDSWETFSPEGSIVVSPAPPPLTSSQPHPSKEERAGQASLLPPGRTGSGLSDTSSDESGTYDHLPTLPPRTYMSGEKKGRGGTQGTVTLGEPVLDIPRRNISQPALSQPPSARESPCDQFGRFGSIDEESSDEDLEGVTPTNSDDESKKDPESAPKFEGVKLRPKKHQQLVEDPFADLLSPKASGRLRWSQELNPLYDYIKGFKADGVKMYDQTPRSKLVLSTMAGGSEGAGKPPSMILEDESEVGSIVSCNDDLQSVCSSQDPTSPAPSLGDDDFTRETSSRSRRPQLHMYEDVQPHPRKAYPIHNYEDISSFVEPPSPSPVSESVPTSPSPISMILDKRSDSASTHADRLRQKQALKSASVMGNKLSPGRYQEKVGVSPRLGKRQIVQQRRSRTLHVHDDTETLKAKQKPVKVADALKDFSYVMREYRMFFVKLPNGFLSREIVNINKPISELREKLCDYLGVDAEHYQLSVEGACLSTLREGGDSGASEVVRVNKAGLSYLTDSHILADQGPDPIVLQSNLSMRMQGISTSRILALRHVAGAEGRANESFTSEPPSDEDEFQKCWISVVQGNHPLTMDQAVKLAALQYQAYFLDRTAVNSVVGFSRPTEFLPVEYSHTRGVEAKMYKEQESLLKKTHSEIEDDYINYCSLLETYGAVFFPAREPRKKLLQSTKLKPVIFGVGPQGILRVDPKTKELLGFWQYNVLKNWAYSKRTFVLAFRDKSFPIESNQSKWISSLVDFFVDSIMLTSTANLSNQNTK